MKELQGIQITDEEFDRLMVANSNGMEIEVVDGKLVAVEPTPTPEQLRLNRIYKIQTRLNELSQDFVQMQCGAIFYDEEERKAEFQTLHNELRILLGKEPRKYN